MAAGRQTRNLILCFDGTNNEFGPQNTSVIRFIQVLDQDPELQLSFYDPGVGTLPEPGFVTGVGKWFSKVIGLAFGAGLMSKVSDAYGFLMEHWQPGDRVFLFGFSRGAYTARVLAALLHMFGLLPAGSQHLVPYLLRLFQASRRELRKPAEKQTAYWALCEEFRKTFARALPTCDDRRFPIHFAGLFDTVSSVGWVWDPLRLPFTSRNPGIAHVRHAISIDERRCFFRQNQFSPAPGQDLVELWFAGVHSDVGGGYPENEGGLWRAPYAWMLSEAKRAWLLTNIERERVVWERSAVPIHPALEKQHESLQGRWWLAEVFPKLVYHSNSHKRWPQIGLGRRRRVPEGARLHPSACERIRDGVPAYSPSNLPGELVAGIREHQEFEPVVRWRTGRGLESEGSE